MDAVSPSFTAHSAHDPNTFLIGEKPVYTRPITIASGQTLVAGSVLGRVTSGGKFKLSASGAGDGSETPRAVLAQACDASGGDKTALAYFAGDFKEGRLTFGSGNTAATSWLGLAALGIYLVSEQT